MSGDQMIQLHWKKHRFHKTFESRVLRVSIDHKGAPFSLPSNSRRPIFDLQEDDDSPPLFKAAGLDHPDIAKCLLESQVAAPMPWLLFWLFKMFANSGFSSSTWEISLKYPPYHHDAAICHDVLASQLGHAWRMTQADVNWRGSEFSFTALHQAGSPFDICRCLVLVPSSYSQSVCFNEQYQMTWSHNLPPHIFLTKKAKLIDRVTHLRNGKILLQHCLKLYVSRSSGILFSHLTRCFQAVCLNNSTMIEALVAAHADVHLVDEGGSTALSLALSVQKRFQRVSPVGWKKLGKPTRSWRSMLYNTWTNFVYEYISFGKFHTHTSGNLLYNILYSELFWSRCATVYCSGWGWKQHRLWGMDRSDEHWLLEISWWTFS